MRSSRVFFGLAVSGFVLGACSGPKTNRNPGAVGDPHAVKSIVVASDTAAADDCESAVRAAGAQVLYRNESGVLFVDREPAALSLANCQGTVAANEPLTLTTPVNEPTGDLSSLLRLLPAEEMGARSFIQAHPSYDGRGVLVAILDTGIELDHPMLKKTPAGEDKIVDFRDFSGEGAVALAPVTLGNDGTFTANGVSYSAKGILGTEYAFGVFAGSTLNNKGPDAAATDTYQDLGLLVYKGGDGKWKSRLDADGDKSFDTETELDNFAVGRRFVKIGSRRLLATAVNVADDGKSASLAFDDGSHGTHVAGISTGFDPGGLQGVAPGAQVMSLKIGDNRLAGGSTTTASMMLAIDYAAAHGARVVNMSYGIRAGSNVGASTIGRYVDKIAKEKGLIFSISAGNEGPGTLTVGVPADAHLAITNAAYLSKETARLNYGYLGVQNDGVWFFSSVGPLLDGGWKPTLLSPGTAVASVPTWSGAYANYRGTSMASPETTGALALILSAALQEKLPVDRVSITQSVYASAQPVAGVSLIEQGHGLLNVPGALAELQTRKNLLPIEYDLDVNSPTAPSGKGHGIYVRARQLPANPFMVKVTPQFPKDTAPAVSTQLHQLTLQASAPWIHTPGSTWVTGAANSFQVTLDPSVLQQPGLHSERIRAVDNATGKVAFEVPVTVFAPAPLDDSHGHRFTDAPTMAVGQTLRYFLDVPAGATALTVDLSSDGQPIWGQLLDPEGRKVLTLDDGDRTAPQNPLSGSANLTRAGVYELDIVCSVTDAAPAKVQIAAQAYSLSVTRAGQETGGTFELTVQNNFEPLKLRSQVAVRQVRKRQVFDITGDKQRVPFHLSDDDLGAFKSITFSVTTSKAYYDQMTDYPYLLLDSAGKVLGSGGLELQSNADFDLSDRKAGDYVFQVQGSFAKEAPKWAVTVEENRIYGQAIETGPAVPVTLETGQFQTLRVSPPEESPYVPEGFRMCATVSLKSVTGDRTVQETTLCP